MNTPVRSEIMPGVWLTAIQTRKFKSSFWSVQMFTPLREETASMNAVLPRVLRRGTARCPDLRSLGAALNNLYGGVVEPVVMKRGDIQSFGFLATFLDDALTLDGEPIASEAAELLGDLLLRPATRNGRLRTDFVTGEQENLISEIRSQINDKRIYASLQLNRIMCQNEPFGLDRLGTLDGAMALQTAKLDRYYKQLLKECRIELYYCGSVSPEMMSRVWKEALMDLPRRHCIPLPEPELRSAPEQIRQVTECMDVTQAKLALGFRTGIRMDHSDYPALLVANALFGGSTNSRLFLNVREKLSLCYYASSGLDKHKGLLLVHSGVEFDKVETAKAEILAQMEAVKQGDFTKKELTAAKAYVSNQLRTILDTQSSLCSYYSDQTLSAAPLSPEELLLLVQEVTAEAVTAAAAKWQPDTVYLLTGTEETPSEEVQHATT